MQIVKRLFVIVAVLLLVAVAYLMLFPINQHADRSFDASVKAPAYASAHPVVLFDEGHYNVHGLSGTFKPFAELLRSDGYDLRKMKEPFAAASLARAHVLVIVNAAGGSNPKLLGINIVPLRKGDRGGPAFTAQEIEAVRQWVANGGSLLLVADHYPFGAAASNLGAAFGVTMHAGFTSVPEQFQGKNDRGSIEFSRANGLLPPSPIANGRGPSERLSVVQSFTGQSLDANDGIALLQLPPSATEAVPPPPVFKDQPAGKTQGVAMPYGRGRVVVLGEAGMLSAQVDQGHKFGMNVPGNDNRQFVLNTMHWLSGLI